MNLCLKKLTKEADHGGWRTPLIPALGRQRQAVLFEFRGQPGLQREFQDIQGYTEKPCLGERKKEVNQKGREGKKSGLCTALKPAQLLYEARGVWAVSGSALRPGSTRAGCWDVPTWQDGWLSWENCDLVTELVTAKFQLQEL